MAPEYWAAIATLSGLAAMLAVSVRVIDGLVAGLRAAGSPRVLVSGASLGGFVANLHHAYSNGAGALRRHLVSLLEDGSV